MIVALNLGLTDLMDIALRLLMNESEFGSKISETRTRSWVLGSSMP